MDVLWEWLTEEPSIPSEVEGRTGLSPFDQPPACFDQPHLAQARLRR
jgi:hypothetical protein